MAHAHADPDAILAGFLEKGELTEIAHRVSMSLAALANWASENATLLANLHQLLITRAKLLAASVELSALNALADISSSTTSTDDPKLRERALERQRKAAGAILRHRVCIERTPRASGGTHAPANAPTTSKSQTSPTSSNAELRMPIAVPSLDASMPHASMPSSSRQPLPQRKPSLAERLAARRLATVSAT